VSRCLTCQDGHRGLSAAFSSYQIAVIQGRNGVNIGRRTIELGHFGREDVQLQPLNPISLAPRQITRSASRKCKKSSVNSVANHHQKFRKSLLNTAMPSPHKKDKLGTVVCVRLCQAKLCAAPSIQPYCIRLKNNQASLYLEAYLKIVARDRFSCCFIYLIWDMGVGR
jgi:hypothetical protein